MSPDVSLTVSSNRSAVIPPVLEMAARMALPFVRADAAPGFTHSSLNDMAPLSQTRVNVPFFRSTYPQPVEETHGAHTSSPTGATVSLLFGRSGAKPEAASINVQEDMAR
jgi:hypothetical protein